MPPKRKAAVAAAAANKAGSSSSNSKKPTTRKRKAPASKVEKAKDDQSDAGSDAEPASKKARVASDDKHDVPEAAKMVTVLKRGAAPVDPASSFVNTHQVYANDEDVWDAMLNQTEIGKNANKFYVLQLLHPIGNASLCSLFLRWGRVGENGQSQTKGPWSALQAINEFKKQFRSKTGAPWEQRKNMTAKKGKYMWIERSFEDEEETAKDEDSPDASNKKGKEPEKIPDSALAPELQALCRIIFSSKLIDAALSSMNYDANKLPLGKLAKSTILAGFAALKAISEVLDSPEKAGGYGGLQNACEELSGRYYSIIPHNFGRNRPQAINTMVALKKELELVDALGDMEIAQNLITTSMHTVENGVLLNPIDANFRSLQLEYMNPVPPDSKEYTALEVYARDTQGVTHSHIKANVRAAFRVQRRNENEAYTGAGYDKLGDGDRMLLWHGSRSTNFAGILSQGLRIAPPEAPVNGYMFGKGVYFADMMSKSAGYCNAYDGTGLLLLCEVAAKPFFEQNSHNYNAAQDCKAAGKLATKGIGRYQPTEWQDAGEALDNEALKGCHMPKGSAQDLSLPSVSLAYNEYIVYDPRQIRMRYLLMVEM